MQFTGHKDTDREILMKLNDKDLLVACSANKYFLNNVCDENFLKRRFSKYPGIEKYKKDDESWRAFFLKTIYYIAKLKEDFDYDYMFGNPQIQYEIFTRKTKKYVDRITDMLNSAVSLNELALVIYLIEIGSINVDDSLIFAINENNLDILKYLIDNYPYDYRRLVIHASHIHSLALRYLLEVAKRPEMSESEFNELKYSALENAATYENFDAVKYLVNSGTRIDKALINWMLGRGKMKMGSYLMAKKIGRKF